MTKIWRSLKFRESRQLRFVFSFFLLMAVFTSGCRSGKHQQNELLEAELRTRERELAEAQAELTSVKSIRQMHSQGQTIPGGSSVGLRDISFGLGTGGFDADGMPGDEGLQVILVPKDADGSPIKAAGQCTIAAYDLARDGRKMQIGLWEISPDQLRGYWQKGFTSSGYKLSLQWHSPPINEKVKVLARLQSLDGRIFETEKDVNVKPMMR